MSRAGLLVTAVALTLVLLWVGVVSAEQQGLSTAALLVASGIWFSPLLIYFALRRRPDPARALTLDTVGVTFRFSDRPDRVYRWDDSDFGIVLRDESWRPKTGSKPRALHFLYLKPEVVTSLPTEPVAALLGEVAAELVERTKRQGLSVLTRPELIGRRAGQHPALVTRLGGPGSTTAWIGGRPLDT